MYGVLDILGSGKKNVTLHTYGDICPQLLVFFENNSSSDYKRKGSKIRSFGNPLSTEGFITLNEFGDTRSLVQDSTYNYEFPAPSDLYISRHIPMN